MTITLPSDSLAIRRAESVSQQTAIEQARAVAEVAAQVRVAKDFPRDMDGAKAQMVRACHEYDLAERAFYSVPNRGTGSSVHLLRELARCFGNIQHGVVELRRDDEAGISEVQAFAWDVENNTRSVRAFIVPHERMAGGKRKALTDLTDITNNNNSVGARAVRETIRHVLPVDFVKAAERLCYETLQPKDEADLGERIQTALDNFGRGKVTQAQLEARVGRTVAEWDAQDVATLAILWQSLVNGETTKAEEFPEDASPAVTADEITKGRASRESAPDPDDVSANDPALDGGQ